MIVAGTSPVDGFTALIAASLGGRNEIGETLVATSALLFPALGIALAFRAGLFNIGAEGQLIVGALFAGGARRGTASCRRSCRFQCSSSLDASAAASGARSPDG